LERIEKYLKGDKVIWMIALFLALWSVVSVYSFAANLSDSDKSTEFFLFKHAIALISGFALMYYAHKLKFSYYSKLSQVAIWAAVALLALTLIIGMNVNNANRWLMIPVINQSFQASDFAKLALIIYVARMLALKQSTITNFKESIVPIILPVAGICLLILPENFSTAALLFSTCLLLMFIGRVAFKHLALIIGSAVALFGIMLLLAMAAPNLLPRLSTWQARLTNYQSEDSEHKYQSDLAKAAIYNGGLAGAGPGNGSAKHDLPQASSDFIYAPFIEEFGLIGGTILLMFYLILLFRSLRIAARCDKHFGSFVAIGLSMSLVFQAMINMGVSTGILPVTGQNMPLLGMGGTSTWFTCLSIGIILSVSRSVYVENEVTEEKTAKKKSANTNSYVVA
jgi:cell division protein FtsW